MNKLLLSLSVVLVFTGCFSKETNEKREKAKKDAEFIVNNLDKPAVASHLPEKHFSAEQTKRLVESMKDCDWSHKEGRLVSYSTNYNNGKTTALFVYDCKASCGKFRFKLVYSLDGVAPELTDMNVERPLSNE